MDRYFHDGIQFFPYKGAKTHTITIKGNMCNRLNNYGQQFITWLKEKLEKFHALIPELNLQCLSHYLESFDLNKNKMALKSCICA